MDSINKMLAKCTYILFHNEESNYTIAKFKALNSSGLNFTAKGVFFSIVGEEYFVSGVLEENDKYPNTFKAYNVKPNINLNNASKADLITYLGTVTSKAIAHRLVMEIPNIISVIEAKDIQTLCSIKGVGETVADRIIDLHAEQVDYSIAIIGLSKFNLTEAAIKQIVTMYGDPQRAVEIVTENPYVLTSQNGYGFKRCDSMFLFANQDNKDAIKDQRRVNAYVDFLFTEQGQDGNTWIDPKVFMSKVIEYIPEADIKSAIEYINKSPKYITLDVFGQKRITSKHYMELELQVASRLLDMAKATLTKPLNKVRETILHVETNQGFSFDEDQTKAINSIVERNVFLLQGYSGVGKTSVINGVSRVLRDNGYTIAQAALSGKAAKNLSQITGFEGRTIHSLIGFGTHKPFNEENPMTYDVVIIDEISMVNIEIFSALLKAMKPDAKLIMLGDSGQLDSIGVGVMSGIINSGAIPEITLTKIHRQAENSAIITHSIAIRSGVKHSELKVKSPTVKTYGKNQDLEYIFSKNSEEDNIYKQVMIRFRDSIAEYGVDETQILCAAKNSGNASVNNLNYYAQILANPKSSSKKEIEIKVGEIEFILREGDKVLNTKNNYQTLDINGVETPIFNGNTGTIITIDESAKNMIIRFDGVADVVVPINKNKDNIQLGYAITTHKSQGSTIPSVIVALPFHFMLNSRELLYTAITRASKKATLITSPKTFQSTLRKTSKRTQQTNLAIYLQDLEKYQELLLNKTKGVS